MSEKKPCVIYYHAGCSDGFGAAWAAAKAEGMSMDLGSMEFVPWVYGRSYDRIQKPDAEKYYFLDCAPDLETFRRLTESYNKQVYVIDHHATALKALGGWAKLGILDVTRSGAVLAWRFFHPSRPTPPLLQYVQDQDLWHHDLPDSYAINAYINAQRFTFHEWDTIAARLECEAGREQIIDSGREILRFQQKEVERMVAKTHTRLLPAPGDLPGYPGIEISCVNSSSLVSEVCNNILDTHPGAQVAACYWMDGDVEVWSLRSRRGGYDVSALAEKFGGGGHPTSAGFRRVRRG